MCICLSVCPVYSFLQRPDGVRTHQMRITGGCKSSYVGAENWTPSSGEQQVLLTIDPAPPPPFNQYKHSYNSLHSPFASLHLNFNVWNTFCSFHFPRICVSISLALFPSLGVTIPWLCNLLSCIGAWAFQEGVLASRLHWYFCRDGSILFSLSFQMASWVGQGMLTINFSNWAWPLLWSQMEPITGLCSPVRLWLDSKLDRIAS